VSARTQSPGVKVTGERVVTPSGGFNPTWQRHVAAYVRAEPYLGAGRVLDLGCGMGHSYHRLAPRETVGVDIEPRALAGQDRETVVADMRRLPFADSSFPSVLSVQSLEHVPDPERTLEQVARVLDPEGVAVFVTPNRLTLGRPDEIIDPYHYVEFDPGELHQACLRSFGEVEVLGLFGSERYMELFREERATLDRLLRLDPLRLRRLVPRRARQYLYDTLLRRFRPGADPRAEVIGVEDFFLGDTDLEECLDVVAVCRKPRHAPTGGAEGGFVAATACVWCEAPFDDAAERLRGRTRCGHCGAATTDPWPSEAALAAAYGTWYWPASGRRFTSIGDGLLRRTRAAFAARLDAIAPPGPILDVGAGEGVLVDALRRRGRQATGLERDPQRSDLLDLSIEQIEGDGDWSGIVFWHSLEHLPNPGVAIGEAARLLREGGALVVAVPNTDSLQARLFGDRWLHLDHPRHLAHLSERTLREGLRARGFEVDRVSQVRGGQIVIGWIDGLVGLLPGDLRLYQALRMPDAQSRPIGALRRAAAIGAGIVLLPLALAGAAVEVAVRRSGTVCVEARRA
jgi:SAM-dependent methyltransferase